MTEKKADSKHGELEHPPQLGVEPPALIMEYKNYKGATRVREVLPLSVMYGNTEYHPEDGWLLWAFDLEKEDYRCFAMKDIINILGNKKSTDE